MDYLRSTLEREKNDTVVLCSSFLAVAVLIPSGGFGSVLT